MNAVATILVVVLAAVVVQDAQSEELVGDHAVPQINPDLDAEITGDDDVHDKVADKPESAEGDYAMMDHDLRDVGIQTTTCCPNGWVGYAGVCYKLFTTSKSWTNARDACISSGGSLARINSATVHNLIANLHAGDWKAWIGLHDRGWEGDFHWVDNDEHLHGYARWSSGEPTNANGNEDCVEINWGGVGYWNDQNCNKGRWYICQKSA